MGSFVPQNVECAGFVNATPSFCRRHSAWQTGAGDQSAWVEQMVLMRAKPNRGLTLRFKRQAALHVGGPSIVLRSEGGWWGLGSRGLHCRLDSQAQLKQRQPRAPGGPDPREQQGDWRRKGASFQHLCFLIVWQSSTDLGQINQNIWISELRWCPQSFPNTACYCVLFWENRR
jgi:hypothetical protein